MNPRHRILALAGSMLIVMLLGLPLQLRAEDYRSHFGFSVKIPDVWLVLTRGAPAAEALRLSEELTRGLSEDGSEEGSKTSVPERGHVLDAIPDEIRRVVADRIEKGEVEILYRLDESPGEFIDNINVMVQKTRLPKTERQIEAICDVLPREFSRIFGRPIAVDTCEGRTIAGRRAIYFAFDGAIPGTKSLQYQLESKTGETIVMTATVATPRLARMLSEFEAIVSSIRFN